MKTVLVLIVLVATVYCDYSEIVFKENCIGIKYVTPPANDPTSSGPLDSGSWRKYLICCDQEFDPNTQISGFSKDMKREEISKVLKANYDTLTEGKTNCKRQSFGVAK